MRRTLAALFLLILFAQAASAKQATLDDRKRLAQTVANYINDPDIKGYKEFNGARAVELGAAVIEWPGALADWRSVDRKSHGQVSFFYLCDGWNVRGVSKGGPLRVDQITTHLGRITPALAKTLLADLKALEVQNIAYLPPPPARMSC